MIRMRCVDLAREHEIQAEVDCCENSRIDQIHLDKFERKLSGELGRHTGIAQQREARLTENSDRA